VTNEAFSLAGDTRDVILDATFGTLPDKPSASIGLESSAHTNAVTPALLGMATSASIIFNSSGLTSLTSIRLDSSSSGPVQEVVTGEQNVERKERDNYHITLTIISIMSPSLHCTKLSFKI